MDEVTKYIYDQAVHASLSLQIQNAIELNLTLYRLDENNKIVPISAKEYFKAE